MKPCSAPLSYNDRMPTQKLCEQFALLFVSDLPFFVHILRDGRGFFPEGSATHFRHGRRSYGYSQPAIATERLE